MSSDGQPDSFRRGPNTHVNDTDDDRHLHLERIGKDERVVGTVPIGIDTKGVDFAIGDSSDRALPVIWPIEPVGKDVQRLGEDIVVDKSSEDGKGTHQQDEVSTTRSLAAIGMPDRSSLQEESLDILIYSRAGNLLFKDAHGQSSEEHDDSVTNITKHDGKQEGEGNDSE